MARWLLLLALLPGIARADEFEAERIRVHVAVGETKVIEVGWARMHACDDASIVDAEMRDKNADTNVFVIKGKKPGTTDCRVGLDANEGRPSFLYSITVDKPAKAPAKKR